MGYKQIPALTESEVQRFRAKYTLALGNNCWIWRAATDEDGYGIFYLNGRNYKAHRIAYFLGHCIDPDELLVVHKCRNHACVRTDHLIISKHRSHKHENRKRRKDSTPQDTIEKIQKQLIEGVLSQKEIAYQHKLTQSTVSKIKRGGYATNKD